MANFSAPFSMPLSDIKWPKRYEDKPTAIVKQLMGMFAQSPEQEPHRIVKLEADSNVVLKGQGEDVCEAAKRLGWLAVRVQRILQDVWAVHSLVIVNGIIQKVQVFDPCKTKEAAKKFLSQKALGRSFTEVMEETETEQLFAILLTDQLAPDVKKVTHLTANLRSVQI